MRRNEFLHRIENDLQDLQKQAESQDGFVKQAKDAIADAGTKYESFKNRTHGVQSLNELNALAANWESWTITAANKIYDAVDAARERMENERRSTEVTSTGEVVKRSPTRAPLRQVTVPFPCPCPSPSARSRPCVAPTWPSRAASQPQRTWIATWTTCAPALCRRLHQTTRSALTNPLSRRRQACAGGLWRFERYGNHERFRSQELLHVGPRGTY